MGLLSKLFGTVTSTITENHIVPKAEVMVSSIYDNAVVDKKIAKEILEYVLEKYGQETFYNDLDSYITNNGLIENLIHTVRGKSNVQPSNQVEFATTNTYRFINQQKEYRNKGVQQKQIYDIFAWVFDFAFSKANSINPHTDSGKLQNELQRIDSASDWRDERTYAAIESLQREVTSLHAGIMSGSSIVCADEQVPESCPAEFETFTTNIKSIESEYQLKNQFEDAISKYYELLQSVSGNITGQNKKYADKLICTLNCNIALCQANLDEAGKAFRSLESIPKTTAEDSKTYHFVYAAVSIQHNESEKYSDAQIHLDRALKIDPQYHRAFLLRQYLYALIKAKECRANIEELNSHFSPVLSENSDQRLISDFYMNRGVIYLAYDDPFSASDDFKKAIEFGSNEVIAKLNLSAALYKQAVILLPKGERFFYPKVDYAKIGAVLTELKPIVTSVNIDTLQYKLIAEQAIKLFVSACTMIGARHGLSPLTKYLGLTRDYETTRALILGCHEELSDTTLSLLDETDRAFVHYRKLLENNEFDECGKELVELFTLSPERMSAPLFHILLQVFIATKDSESYWKYRSSAASAGVCGDLLDAMDACAFEIDGKPEQAKTLFNSIASTSDDYQLLDNTLRFFKRNMFNSECSALYLRIQELHEKGTILIEDLDEFYNGAIRFFVSINSPLAEDMIRRIAPQEVSSINFSRMQASIYSKTNDVGHLATCLSQIYGDMHNFQDGFNLALCQKWLMSYDCSLTTCFELSKASIENDNLVKLYWLISDLYLLKEDYDDSYAWAQKAHELMIQNPYDQSHQALFGRALRCGHQEGFAKILEYKKTHPVVVDWIEAFSIEKDENPVESLIKQLEKFSPNAKSYSEQEKYLASKYRSQTIPINRLLEFYHNDLGQLFRFAEKNKIRISMGDRNQLQNEEKYINHHIAVDAQTLIILSYYGCLPALQSIEHIHINYGSLNTLQNYYLSFDYPYVHDLLRWIESADNITFHPDGFIEDGSTIIKALSRNFIASCVVSKDNNIPLLYSDSIAYACTAIPELNIFQKIAFVSIPALCNYYGQNYPESRDQMLYRLLTGCTFVSFSANTIINQIVSNNYSVSLEAMRPFLICKSDYDTKSFADVYLQAINGLYSQNHESAIKLSELIIDDTFRVWRRGTHYRMMAKEYNSIVDKARVLAISRYVFQIVAGIKQIVPNLSADLTQKCEELEHKAIIDYI